MSCIAHRSITSGGKVTCEELLILPSRSSQCRKNAIRLTGLVAAWSGLAGQIVAD